MSKDNVPGSRKWNQLTEEVMERKVRENGGPIRLRLPPVTHVDLNTGVMELVTGEVAPEHEGVCLSAWSNGQSDFVPLPEIGERTVDGFRMIGRVLGSPSDDKYPTPGANFLIVESPNGAWAMTVGFARREPDGADLWKILLGTAGRDPGGLKYPPLLWMARDISVSDGAFGLPRVLPEIAYVERTMVLSLFRYYALIDYINVDDGRVNQEGE